MEDRERRRQLRDQRVREWQNRRRDPGDLVTWAVVLGGLMAVMLFLCAAYDGNTLLGLAVLILNIAWVLVVWAIAGVNVVSILWGRTISDDFDPRNAPLVLLTTGVLALISIVFPLIDFASGFNFGWYGVISGAVGLVYFIMLAVAGGDRSP